MKLSVISLATFFLLAQLPVLAQSLEDVFTKEDRLIYREYEVTRSVKPGADAWTITIKKNGRALNRFETGSTMSKDWVRLGLFNFLGGQRKQLVVEGYSGGAHCCWEYRIIDLSPTYRVLYDSNDWDVGYELDPVDLDKDGVFEFTQSVMTFDYFYVLSHARSPFPRAIFKYDKKSGKYLPANRLFPGEIAQDLTEDLADVARLSRNISSNVYQYEEYVAATLSVFLKYAYAGKEPQAWTFFDAEYKLDDKPKLRSEIRKQLRGCSIYNYIYPRRK